MPIIKITLFQKNILSEISRDQKQKLISQKSDFVVFPELFPLTGKWSEKSPAENSKIYVDRLLEISEYYRGSIIGGTIIRKIDGKLYYSCPIIKDVQVVDWYDKHEVNSFPIPVQKGQGEGIYMLDSLRFGICIGDDIHNTSITETFKKEKIEVIFNPSASLLSAEEEKDYTQDLQSYSELSKNSNLNIIRVSSIGEFNKNKLTGRSLFAAPSGIKWKVAPFENNMEIIKTVSITTSGIIS